MKTIILSVAILGTVAAKAQDTLMQLPLTIAGQSIEQVSNRRIERVASTLILSGISAYAFYQPSDGAQVVGKISAVACVGLWFTFEINIAGHERRAGRALQGKPPN